MTNFNWDTCNCRECQQERNQEILDNHDCEKDGRFEGCIDCLFYQKCGHVDWNE